MNVRFGLATAIAFAGLMASSGAFAASIPMGTLLTDGWEVVDTEVIAKDIVSRAMSNEQWVDDVLITLHKGGGLAFCHVTLVGTITDPNILTYGCQVLEAAPAGDAPPPVPSNAMGEPAAPAQ